MKTIELPLLPLSETEQLQRILWYVLQDGGEARSHQTSENESLPFWDLTYFQFHKTTLFQQITPQEKWLIRQHLSQYLLTEAYFLKKISIESMTQMAKSAQHTPEQLQYTLFSADETYHFTQVMGFLSTPPLETEHLWFRFLQSVVQREEQSLLLFLGQVFLKGWSFTYYQQLQQKCCNRELTKIFQHFLPQESFHHQIGVTRYQQNPACGESLDRMIETLAYILYLMTRHSHPMLAIAERVTGYLSRSQKIQLLEELEIEQYAHQQFTRIRSLIAKERSGKVLKVLEERGIFEPLTVDQLIDHY